LNRTIQKLLIHGIYTVVPDSYWVSYAAYLPKFQSWRKSHKGKNPIFHKKEDLYDFVNREIIQGKAMQYLEFGVYKGETIKYFSGINSDPGSKFVGFDSFSGLPEDWIEPSGSIKRKTFDTGGTIPETDDQRISFVTGYFQDSLPGFLKGYRTTNQLVMHIDCDLYSSTLFVLTTASPIIVRGTIIIFDEFYSVVHEFRALDDYCSAYMRKYEVLAGTNGYGQVAIRML